MQDFPAMELEGKVHAAGGALGHHRLCSALQNVFQPGRPDLFRRFPVLHEKGACRTTTALGIF